MIHFLTFTAESWLVRWPGATVVPRGTGLTEWVTGGLLPNVFKIFSVWAFQVIGRLLII